MPADPREYITLTLDFPDHPKFSEWTDSARFKLIRLWMYCARHRTDGFVPAAILRQICRADVLEKLRKLDGVDWLEDGSGIRFVDYTEHQRSRAQIAEKRGKASSAGVRSGQSRRQRRQDTTTAPGADQSVCHRTEEEEEVKDLRPTDSDLFPEKHSRTESDAPKPPDLNIWFDLWWAWYPRKVGKPAAFKSFKSALKNVDFEELHDRTKAFALDPNLPSGDERQFIPHPATWLNQERWRDLPLPPRRKSSIKKSAQERAQSALQIGEQLLAESDSRLRNSDVLAPEFSVEFDSVPELKAAG
ncbi:hypothetical protein [Nocardia sp. NPDC050435]|uniref:hypothetical protein n=1 Tax=Nocardia sp. NPDC050435 TaxID=3155040 RepID=UPI0033EC6CF3